VILRKINDVNYLIRQEKGPDRVVDHDKLKNYEGANKPRWLSKHSRILIKVTRFRSKVKVIPVAKKQALISDNGKQDTRCCIAQWESL
ncbi:MAG: hypothetical protein AB2693_07340, partial [Candidatus Thiodiazotropha sp.]